MTALGHSAWDFYAALKGVAVAISTVVPWAIVQTCIVPLIRRR